MQFTLSILALAASLLSVNAESHGNLHRRVHARELSKRLIQVNSLIQVLPSVNSPDVQEGAIHGMPYHNQIVNNASDDATVLFWAKEDFSLPVTVYNTQAPAPLLRVVIPAGETKTVSFSNNFNGAYAPVYKDTKIGAGGNVQEAWVELTTTLPPNFNPATDFNPSTVDVSYLANTKGRWTSVEVDKCFSDKKMCSFTCTEGMTSCYKAEDVKLLGCDSKNTNNPLFQEKANSWQNPATGAYEGGCFLAGTKKFVTTLNSSQ